MQQNDVNECFLLALCGTEISLQEQPKSHCVNTQSVTIHTLQNSP